MVIGTSDRKAIKLYNLLKLYKWNFICKCFTNSSYKV